MSCVFGPSSITASVSVVPPSPQPPFVSCAGVLSSSAEQGDDMTVLNGCQEEYRSSSAKAQTHTQKRTPINGVSGCKRANGLFESPLAPPTHSALHPPPSLLPPHPTHWQPSLCPLRPAVHCRPRPPSRQRPPYPPTGGAGASQPELPVRHAAGQGEEDQHQHGDWHQLRHGCRSWGTRGGQSGGRWDGPLGPHPTAGQELQGEERRPFCGCHQRRQVCVRAVCLSVYVSFYIYQINLAEGSHRMNKMIFDKYIDTHSAVV